MSSRLRFQSGLSNIHMEWLAFQIVSERFWFRDAQACDDPSLIPPGVLESLSHWLLVLCTTTACPEFTNYIMISPTPACLKYHLCESVCQSPWRVLWCKAGNIVHCPRRQIILKLYSSQVPQALRSINMFYRLGILFIASTGKDIWNNVSVLCSTSLTQHQYALKARNIVHCLHRQI